MNQLFDFFKGLFATNEWPARWHCGNWSDFHGWLYIISDLLIWTAYFLIPAIILQYTTRKQKGLKFPKVYFLFAAFILLCGTTHFFDAMMFWVPMYRLNALIRFATAIVSMLTVFYLVRILPDLFKQKTNLELEREINRRKEAEKKLAIANKGLEAFAYMASHDLQEPLRKIGTYSSILEERNNHLYDERSKELSGKISSSANRLRQLINDVLNLSSISGDIEFEPVPLDTAVAQSLEDLEIKIAEHDAIVRVEKMPTIQANKNYITQLFTNLIGNAIKFCDQQPVIEISSSIQDDVAVIQIKDNGIGMEADETEKIFDAFQRLNKKGKYEGTGIGLAICKRIVEVHNGQISVSSKPGQGTIFTITLPLFHTIYNKKDAMDKEKGIEA